MPVHRLDGAGGACVMSRPGPHPTIVCRGFLRVYGNCGPDEWQAGQRRLRVQSWTGSGSELYLPVNVKARYWISYATRMGRVHLATGKGVRCVRESRWQPHKIVVQLHCGTGVAYARAIDSPDAAPGFTLCPRCIDAAYGEPAS